MRLPTGENRVTQQRDHATPLGDAVPWRRNCPWRLLRFCYSIPMPTILRVGPYRFFFYANDRTEPIHVHIEREAYKAKFWVAPVRLAVNRGFRPAEIRSVQRIIRKHERLIVEKWHEYFDA